MDGSGAPSQAPVLLDTNALLLPWTRATDLRDELTRLGFTGPWTITAGTDAELSSLAEGSSATARAAAAAKRHLIPSCHIKATRLPGDDGILELATAQGAIVVTDDGALAAEARKRGVRVVSSRGHGRLYDRSHAV